MIDLLLKLCEHFWGERGWGFKSMLVHILIYCMDYNVLFKVLFNFAKWSYVVPWQKINYKGFFFCTFMTWISEILIFFPRILLPPPAPCFVFFVLFFLPTMTLIVGKMPPTILCQSVHPGSNVCPRFNENKWQPHQMKPLSHPPTKHPRLL